MKHFTTITARSIATLLSTISTVCTLNTGQLFAVELLWATGGGSEDSNDRVSALETANDSSVFIGGSCSTNTEFGQFKLEDRPNDYVAKLDKGGAYQWATGFSNGTVFSNDSVSISDLASDSNNDVYVMGYVRGTTLKIGATEFQLSSTSPQSATFDRGFVAKLDGASGNAIWFHETRGFKDNPLAIAVDSSRSVVFAAFRSQNSLFAYGANIELPRIGAGDDLIVLKLDSATGEAEWGTRTTSTSGTNDFEAKYFNVDLAIDGDGDAYVTGSITGRGELGGIVLPASPPRPSVPSGQILLAKIDSTGQWLWAKQFGGSFSDTGLSIALDRAGNIFVTGNCSRLVDFGNGVSVNTDGSFIAKFTPDGNALWASAPTKGQVFNFRVCVDPSGNAFIAGGSTRDRVEFGGLEVAGKNTVMVAKIAPDGKARWLEAYGGVDSYSGSWHIALDSSGNVVLASDSSDPFTIDDQLFNSESRNYYTLTFKFQDPEGSASSGARFSITEFAVSATEVRLTWTPVPGGVYAIEGSANLEDWTTVAGFEAISSTSASIPQQPGAGSFTGYRVRAVMP